MRMSRKVKDYLIEFVLVYANRVKDSLDPVAMLNQFESAKAAAKAEEMLLTHSDLSEKEKEFIKSEEGKRRIFEFFHEKLLINYFMLARNISYYEAKSLLLDKGTDFFEETKGIKHSCYPGRFKDYPATKKQIEYLKSFGITLLHEPELSGREASLILSCFRCPTKTKPAYYSYYIGVNS